MDHPADTFTLGQATNTFWSDRYRWDGAEWQPDWRGYEYYAGAIPPWDFYVWPGSYLAKHVWILEDAGWRDLHWQYNFDD
jgi:hypothetical protein